MTTSNTQKAYITTPIYYPSGAPHLGSAYTSVACDIYARFKRLDGYNVKFLTGTDEHGLKIQRKAEEQGLTPQAYVDKMSAQFSKLTPIMNLSNDDFIRTTEPRHIKAVQAFWKKIQENDEDEYIYKASYSGWYCVSDEAYYTESELVEGKAPSGHPVEWMEEESYFFKLSAFQDKLLAHIEANPHFIQPKSRRNEVLAFIKAGLEDISISRTTFNWGVPVPGDEKHVMYVWIDALCNYISAAGYPAELSHWPAVHMVGKDILRFHAIYWPAFLMAANIELPEMIFAHGWWTSEGKKMSKSFGNVVDPKAITEKYGIDQVRYFMFREVPFGNDGDFSEARLIERINADLANNLGNLCQRVLAMVQKNCDGKVPALQVAPLNKETEDILTERFSLARFIPMVYQLKFNDFLDEVMGYLKRCNQYMDTTKPWELRKENPEEMAHVLRVLMEAVAAVSLYLEPFIPDSARKIQHQLAFEGNNFDVIKGVKPENFASAELLSTGTLLPKPTGVFPRIDNKEKTVAA